VARPGDLYALSVALIAAVYIGLLLAVGVDFH
jgi:hypothetical protein